MFTPGASSAFQAAEDVTDSTSRHAAPGGSPQSSPTDRSFLTFVLSHVFVLPGAAEQHQPHSPADTELRVDSRAEPASHPWVDGIPACPRTGARPCCCASPLRYRQPTRSLLQHAHAALHSREAPTNGDARGGGGQGADLPIGSRLRLINAALREAGGEGGGA